MRDVGDTAHIALARQDQRDGAERRAAAAADLHRQRHDQRAAAPADARGDVRFSNAGMSRSHSTRCDSNAVDGP